MSTVLGSFHKEAHRNGVAITNRLQTDKTKERVEKLLKDDTYIKPNGNVNKTALAKALNMYRRTLDKYL